jgi:hypothetical protein
MRFNISGIGSSTVRRRAVWCAWHPTEITTKLSRNPLDTGGFVPLLQQSIAKMHVAVQHSVA